MKRGKRRLIAALAMTNDSGVAWMTASNVRERERERELVWGRGDLICMTTTTNLIGQ